jgi:hypothetical protein
MSWVTVSLLRPDGSAMTSSFTYVAAFNLATQTLPTSGTYTITIDPYSFNAGSITVSVTSP